MGGGISSLSKICVVGPPTTEQAREGIHVQYTFVQVGIRDNAIDYSGNCGNLSSMIGVFAVDEGLCEPQLKNGLITVRSFNTNTQKIIDTTFPASHRGVPLLDLPQTSIAGVSGTASRIILDFVNPGGARTGNLLPAGNPTDVLEVSDGHRNNLRSFTASLLDATNPTVFLSYDELAAKGLPMEDYINGVQPFATRVGALLEGLRQAGAKKMGLDPTG
jgi:2-methylaconitate cis-trans-isomerase PrpF